ANKLFLPWASKISWATPNQVTILSFLLYATGVVGINFWPHDWIILALFLPLSYILDCLDGQLARTTGKMSVIGDYLDKTLDVCKISLINGGFGYFAYHQTGHVYYLLLALLSCFGFLYRYYIKLETMFSAIGRDKEYLDKSRVYRLELYEKYEQQKRDRHTLTDYVKWYAFKNRAVFALDEAEHVTFGALAILTDKIWLWCWIFGIGQVLIALFRLWQRGYQLSRKPERLLYPMRK
ncbi:MAG TPA: CDP-alcohol phosphatidyltransferase family protein, partial [Verrucomicrobiae bacterium]|nr:CDP-alcohol phosphatidyltransferase family protein [Verrucomicrobiae bacterium]